jgi:hypothetical protein
MLVGISPSLSLDGEEKRPVALGLEAQKSVDAPFERLVLGEVVGEDLGRGSSRAAIRCRRSVTGCLSGSGRSAGNASRRVSGEGVALQPGGDARGRANLLGIHREALTSSVVRPSTGIPVPAGGRRMSGVVAASICPATRTKSSSVAICHPCE